MPAIFFRSVPFVKEDVTRALEAGVDGVITDAAHVQAVAGLARCDVRSEAEMPVIVLAGKEDEEHAAARASAGESVVLGRGWEVIPVENLLARPDVAPRLAVEAGSAVEARLAAGILECGVPMIVLLPEALPEIGAIVAAGLSQGRLGLLPAVVREVRPVGLGHRVCIDTLSLLHRGQGMLVGNSSAFTFLVHAETEDNEYVAARPFRINAGGVHSYIVRPGDRTSYAGELAPGDETLVVNADGETTRVTVGRIKTEIRPMLYIRAEWAPECTEEHGVKTNGTEKDARDVPGRSGGIFLQNAETIRLVRPDGSPVSVVELRPGDRVLCHPDDAGRHFGMRIREQIRES